MTRTVLDKEIRRQQLLDAAIKVFARKGYHAASIDDIIKEADVARGTFYLYFEGKKEIFLAIIDFYFEKLRAISEGIHQSRTTHENYRQHMREAWMAWLGFFVRHRDLVKIMYREANSIDESFERRWYELGQVLKTRIAGEIRALQEAGCFGRSVSPQAACLFIAGMFQEVVCDYILRVDKPDLEWLVDQLVDFQLHGIAPKEVG